ncbi:hypothetical protein D1646_21990, partial [Pseudoflavonifractor sp. 60]|uniref:hypothetical protein n=1 Tax=Pseudoflavonifractor sp. 60 TaxID=2304576 RepID=UPI0013708239
TRNQVAQLALNTLKSPVVQADKSGSDIVIGSGDTAVTITGQSKYVVTASSEPYARAIKQNQADDHTITGEAGYIIELGEKLYNGQLKLNDDAVDEFGRPANYWEYNAKKMGTYVKRDLIQAEYTEKVTGKMLFTELGRDLVNDIDTQTKAGKFDYTLSIYIDGEAVLLDNKTTTSTELLKDVAFDISDITNSNTDGVGGTGNGVLTQVFVDSQYGRESGSGKGVIISIMNTYLAIANKDYDSKKDEVEVEVYKIDDRDPSSSKYVYAKTGYSSTEKKFFTEDIKVSGDRFDIEDVKKDDKFLVTVAEGEIQSMVTPEIASEVTLNSFKRNDWVKNDDVQYDYASTAQYDDDVLDIYDNINMKDVTYNVILDQYGYLIGIELNEAIAQYVFMTGIDLGTSNLSRKNADANVIFTDGTMKTVTVNTDKSELASSPKKEDGTSEAYTITGGGDKLDKMFGNGTANFSQVNRWFTYTVDADGVYTVKEVGNNSQAREDGYRTAKKIAQSFIDADTYSNDKFDVNGKNRSLDGSKVKTPAGDFNKVYGNADSIYINAKLTDINDKNSNAKLIVEKVDSVTTGIDNVDFTVENITDANNPGDEAYVLYNNDGYIIAAVILNAEDNGTSAKYAYVTSGIKQEDYLGSNTWRWGVDAIIDGEKVRLTEVNDSQEYIKEGMQGKWYDVRFDKDGNVSSIKANDNTTTKPAPINFTYVDPATGKNDKYITNVHNVARATNGVNGDGKGGTLVTDDAGIYHGEKFEDFTEKLSSLLLYQDFRCNSHAAGSGVGTQGTAKLTYKNMTLYTDTKATAGLGISPSTKIIVILSKSHNDGLYDTISDTFTGDSGMKDALKMLDSNEKAFDGWLGAVIKDGIATSIILHDQAGDKDKQGTTPIVPDEKPGVETTLSVVSGTDGVSFTTSNVSAYNKDDEALRGSAIRGGVRYNVKTAEDITIDLPKLNANQKYHVVAAPAANVTGLPADGNLEGETLNIKLANGAATLTVTV